MVTTRSVGKPKPAASEVPPKPKRSRGDRDKTQAGWNPQMNAISRSRNTAPGQLQGLMNMPIDIFAEVCLYLAPLDLRSLSLTSKRLRYILMPRNSRHIWATARIRTYGGSMPECPPDLSEPQYTCFMFTLLCSKCGRGGAQHPDFYHRIRYCRKCEKENMISSQDIRVLYPDFPPPDILRFLTGLRWISGRAFHKPNVEAVFSEYVRLPSEEDDQRGNRRDAFRKKLEAQHKERKSTAEALSAWIDDEIDRQEDELGELYTRRLRIIREKLLELGHDERDLHPRHDNDFARLADKPKEFTLQEWRLLRPKAERVVAGIKGRRLEHEKVLRAHRRRDDLNERFLGLWQQFMPSPSCWLPNALDFFFNHPSVRLLMDADTDGVSPDMWLTVAEELEHLVIDRQEVVLRRLSNIRQGEIAVSQTTPAGAEGSGPMGPVTARVAAVKTMATELSLATSLFACLHCETVIWFPHILHHCSAAIPGELHFDLLTALPPDCDDIVLCLFVDLDVPQTTSPMALATLPSGLLLCGRCDPRVACYRTLHGLVTHYVQARMWFNDATASVIADRKRAYPHLSLADPLPTIFDDHDWTENKKLLTQHNLPHAKASITKIQNRFRLKLARDDLDYLEEQGVRPPAKGEPAVPIEWTCKLCPVGFSPLPMAGGRLKLHIESRHLKAPDLETDAEIHCSGAIVPQRPCPCT